MPDTPPMSRVESDAEKAKRQSVKASWWHRFRNLLRAVDGEVPEDNPDYDARPEDAKCPDCAILGTYNRELQAEIDKLRQRIRELEAGLDGETLPERVRREAAMTPTEQEEYRRTWEETREALRDADFGEYPLDDATLTPRRLIPHTTTMVEVGTREPGKRAKAPTWKQHRYRVADEGHGLDRIKAPFGMTEGQVRGNRKRVLTSAELADRFDLATQAAREIREES